MIQGDGHFSAPLGASGQLRLGLIDPSLHAAPASASQGSASRSLPLNLEADLRALPPAPVALALIPLLVLLVLALRPESRFRDWCRTSFDDFLGLFRPIRRRRHVIHDKPYLDRVLQAEFGGRRASSSASPPSTASSSEKPAAREAISSPPRNEPGDRSS